ncbi:proline-rich protein 11-like [Argopecten irradians]|uniref:proline-rich protein 11-like n=1 Tax=Argopecten irradians TaxID=31199 RepID=UPI00372298C3
MFENQDFNREMEPFSLSPYRNRVDVSGPDPIAWFRTGQLVAAATGVTKILTWCSRCLGVSLNVARNKVFPHQWYQEELQRMSERLSDLERELHQLQESKPVQSTDKTSVYPTGSCSGCRCPQCGKSVSVVPVAQVIPIQQTGAQPPPPPPPPPPPVHTPTPTFIRKRKRRMSSKEESTPRPSVTLEQLQQVKLRRAEPRPPLRPENNNNTPSSPELRHRLLKTALHQDKENIQDRIASEVLSFKGGLKKTTIKRSPGGTPLVKRKRATGKGLTPMMATALKKKFVFANDSRSSSDDSLEGSPSPRYKISPLALVPDRQSTECSPCNQSPLTDNTI